MDLTRGGKFGGKQLDGKVLDVNSIYKALLKKGLLNPKMSSSGGLPPSLGSPKNVARGREMPMVNGGQVTDFSKSMAGGKVTPDQVGSSGGPKPGRAMIPMKSGGSGGPLAAGLNNRRGPVPSTTTKTTTTTTQAQASNNYEAAYEIIDEK